MSEIPDDIWEAARSLRGAVLWESNSAVEFIAKALNAERLAAEQRGREMEREKCATVAEGKSTEFDFQKALSECRDVEHGFHSGRLHAAAAIRSRTTEPTS